MQFETNSATETQKIANNLIRELNKTRSDQYATFIALKGDLGTGKTTFTQGLAQALGLNEATTSPTFVLMKQYPLNNQPFKLLIHIDAYRLNSASELAALGFEELVASADNLIVLEWPERVPEAIPLTAKQISLTHGGGDKRLIEID